MDDSQKKFLSMFGISEQDSKKIREQAGEELVTEVFWEKQTCAKHNGKELGCETCFVQNKGWLKKVRGRTGKRKDLVVGWC